MNARHTITAKRSGRCGSGGGFTLVECLAVVALLALTVATIAVGIAPSTGEARLREARSVFLDLDARARALALRGEPVILTTMEGLTSVRVGAESILTLEREIPPSVEAALLDSTSRESLDSVRIDACGRGRDYILSLRSGERRTETLVAGLTGYAFEATEVGP